MKVELEIFDVTDRMPNVVGIVAKVLAYDREIGDWRAAVYSPQQGFFANGGRKLWAVSHWCKRPPSPGTIPDSAIQADIDDCTPRALPEFKARRLELWDSMVEGIETFIFGEPKEDVT